MACVSCVENTRGGGGGRRAYRQMGSPIRGPKGFSRNKDFVRRFSYFRRNFPGGKAGRPRCRCECRAVTLSSRRRFAFQAPMAAEEPGEPLEIALEMASFCTAAGEPEFRYIDLSRREANEVRGSNFASTSFPPALLAIPSRSTFLPHTPAPLFASSSRACR